MHIPHGYIRTVFDNIDQVLVPATAAAGWWSLSVIDSIDSWASLGIGVMLVIWIVLRLIPKMQEESQAARAANTKITEQFVQQIGELTTKHRDQVAELTKQFTEELREERRIRTQMNETDHERRVELHNIIASLKNKIENLQTG